MNSITTTLDDIRANRRQLAESLWKARRTFRAAGLSLRSENFLQCCGSLRIDAADALARRCKGLSSAEMLKTACPDGALFVNRAPLGQKPRWFLVEKSFD